MLQLHSQSQVPPSGMPPGGMPPNGMKPDFGKKLSLDDMLTKMTTELDLNELQQLQVREILKDMEKKNSFSPTTTKSGERPNFQEMKEKMQAVKNEMTVKLSKVLSVDQLKKWNDESDNWNQADN